MSDSDLIQAATSLAIDRLKLYIEDSGPIGLAALDYAALLISQAIDEAYTTRFEATRIEFEDLDSAKK